MKIEQILATGKSFKISPLDCQLQAEKLSSYSAEVTRGRWAVYDKASQLVFKVAFISICHQFNWDFLQNALAVNFEGGDILQKLRSVQSKDLSLWLADYHRPERIRGKERARLLRNVGQVIFDEYGSVESFYEKCSTCRLGGNEFLDFMDKFIAYRSDKLRKKTNVLSHDLTMEKIVNFPDLENLNPAIDYHIMRLYIRTGRVVPAHETVFKFLEGAPNPRGSLVRQLRGYVGEALKLTAMLSGKNVAEINHLEWQIGRSICLDKKPLCTDLPNKRLSSAFTPHLCGCPYVTHCLSYNRLERFLRFTEPDYISSDY